MRSSAIEASGSSTPRPYPSAGSRTSRRSPFARAAGYQRLRLWTTNLQVAARAVYLSAGFELTGEEPYAGFGPAVSGQTYELAL